MKRGSIVLLIIVTLTAVSALAGLKPPIHVTIDVSSLTSQDLQLELALYDNSDVMGDSWVLIDNMKLGSVTEADFESGTLEGFDSSLNPASVSVVAGALDGTGQYLMRMDEDPVTFVTFTWRDFPGSGAQTLEFDLQMQASEVEGFWGLDEFVVNVLDPDTLTPLLPQLDPGGILALTAEELATTPEVSVGEIAQGRIDATRKGSLLIFPKIELRWDSGGNLVQDTFIDLANDFNEDVWVLAYFVSEACNWVDNDFALTHNEPAYWSAATGLPKGVSPFTVLGEPYEDPEGSSDTVLRGYVVLWAINPAHEEIRWNHLYGQATIVNYAHGCAWEYNAYAFPARLGENGEQTGDAGVINLDGIEYDNTFDKLLLDFFASDSTAFSNSAIDVVHDTDLTLLIVDMDLRQETEGPYTTKADFEIWNENEVSFSGMHYCLTKWDQSLLSSLGGHFLVENLQTNKGRARIDGVASGVCDSPDVTSVDAPLLGVAAKLLTFDGVDLAMAGMNLYGTGTEATQILYDIPEPPEEKGMNGAERTMKAIGEPELR